MCSSPNSTYGMCLGILTHNEQICRFYGGQGPTAYETEFTWLSHEPNEMSARKNKIIALNGHYLEDDRRTSGDRHFPTLELPDAQRWPWNPWRVSTFSFGAEGLALRARVFGGGGG